MRLGISVRRRLCSFLVLSSLLIGPSTFALGQQFDASSLTAPASPAAGWRVQADDNPAFAYPAFDDSAWPAFDARDSIANVFPGHPSVIWYRLHVKVRPGQQGLALRAVGLSRAFEIYVNGRRVLRSGSIAPFKPYTEDGLLLVPISSADTSSGSLLIALRVRISRYAWDVPDAGLWYENLALGQYAALDNADWLHVIGDHALGWLASFAWLAMALGALALFTAHRAQREYLWIFLFSVTLLLQLPLDLSRLFHNIPATWELARQPLVVASNVFNLLIFLAILRIRFNWWFRGLIALACAGIGVSWLGFFHGSLPALASLAVQIPFGILWALVLPILLLVHYRRGNREAGILLIAALVQSFFYCVEFTIDLLQALPPTRMAAYNFSRIYLNFHLGPFLMDFGSLCGLLYAVCLSVIIVLRATRISRQQALMENELEAAHQVQNIILAKAIETVPGFRVETVYHPAQRVGGDFFQLIAASSGGTLVVIGDVAGKGLPAAMLVSLLVGAVRTVAAYSSEPAVLLASLNERLVGRAGGGFATALVAHIATSGLVSIANAGHLPPYLDGVELELPGALPLGIESGTHYEVRQFRLQPGSRLTLISDGVVEAQNERGELFGFERSRELSRQPAAEIAETARRFGQCDDITVVAIQRAPAAELVAEAVLERGAAEII